MERDECAGEIGEDLRGGDEVSSEPLAEAELDENEKAPNEHPLKEARGAAGEEFASNERKSGEGESEHFRDGQDPERGGEAGELREKSGSKLLRKMRRDPRYEFADARETPDHEVEKIDSQQCAADGSAREFWVVEHAVVLAMLRKIGEREMVGEFTLVAKP